jgi:hypothetical protein
MKGLADGLAWRAQVAYASREIEVDEVVEEVVRGPRPMRLFALRYGSKLVLNMD